MKKAGLIFIFLTGLFHLKAQMYFPPDEPDYWETLEPSRLGWSSENADSLRHFLETNNTKAFILLKDGKIVLEWYFADHTQASPWYWASAGKSLTAFLVGIAQQEGRLSINDSVSHYLGKGWSSCTALQEGKITIRHLLTMTSGLNDEVDDPYCTLDTCLVFKADAGTRWAYHNAPYTLLDPVLERATGMSLNSYASQKLKEITGISGLFIKQGYNNVFLSTARSMARFGLLILNGGRWNTIPVLSDTTYYNQMIRPSQSLNPAYGYLWWLNGKDAFMLPGMQLVIPGKLFPDAPSDVVAALGKNGQFINVVPEENLVWIRMGNEPTGLPVPFLLNNQIWQYINRLPVGITGAPDTKMPDEIEVFPIPATSEISVRIPEHVGLNGLYVSLYTRQGSLLMQLTPPSRQFKINVSAFPKGICFLVVKQQTKTVIKKILVI